MPTHLLLLGASLSSLSHLQLSPGEAVQSLTSLPVTTLLADADQLDEATTTALQKRRISVIARVNAFSEESIARLSALSDQVKLHSINIQFPAKGAAPSLLEFAADQRIPVTVSLPDTLDWTTDFTLPELQERPSYLLDLNSLAWGSPLLPASLPKLEHIIGHTDFAAGHLHESANRSPALLLTEIMRRWRTSRPVGSSFLFFPEAPPASETTVDETLTSLRAQWEIAKTNWKQAAAAGRDPVWPSSE